ncbi:gamma-glutamyltransferase [Alkalimonas sp. MEB108]|uniref:Gamma-glutamyltransferase n=1 Tax=Alkalimonas cellulosilytica TaxID=3058395 RepID=A0ABU7JA77_9GAMM|nr:gamma-glutamyltransferase [Alkalimonas sp. MEB108]MEE2003402.1 gamma-glutamyltransferase [Alkalimonas sp. MEB108]
MLQSITKVCFICVAISLSSACYSAPESNAFKGAVSSASPEATEAGLSVLRQGGNAIDAAVAVSLALGVSEPAGSGIAGQTVMLVHPGSGKKPFVIHGTSWSPSQLPERVEPSQLRVGHTASTVPSTPRVLDFAFRNYGSGQVSWSELVQPAINIAENGFVIGPFRERSFRYYGDSLRNQPEAKAIFIRHDGKDFQVGDILVQSLTAKMLRRIAEYGAEDFYSGEIAVSIAKDMATHQGWITLEDLNNFPDPQVVEPLVIEYQGYQVATLPPPFGGWVMLKALNLIEQQYPNSLPSNKDDKAIAFLDALHLAHLSRFESPVSGFYEYHEEVDAKISKQEAARLLSNYHNELGGETTHFSVVDASGMAVSVTQSIDSYFGAKVVNPDYGFLYNNYMQSFRLIDDGSPYGLKPNDMPYSSMAASILSKNGEVELVLGSPGSARIISAVAQVIARWVQAGETIEEAVAAHRVHAIANKNVFIEQPEVSANLMQKMALRGFTLRRPQFGVADSVYDPYFGGVHAIARQNGVWQGAADPRRDGKATVIYRLVNEDDRP